MTKMSRGSVREYTEAIRGRYQGSDRKGKGRILDEFTQVTGYHRKAAIRLLRRNHGPPRGHKGRPRHYWREVVEALKVAWEASDHLCGKRLKPFLLELVDVLRKHGEVEVTSEVARQLSQVSAATIDRLLKPYRCRGIRRPFTTTKPALQEERQRSRGAEELVSSDKAGGLQPVFLQGCLGAAQPGVRPGAPVYQLLPA